jgi:hypothetical protein
MIIQMNELHGIGIRDSIHIFFWHREDYRDT